MTETVSTKTKLSHREDKINPPPRPLEYDGSVLKYKTGCGSIFVIVSLDDSGYPIEVFAKMGRSGTCSPAIAESIGRTISVALQCGVDAAELAEQLLGIQCPSKLVDNGVSVSSCMAAVGLALATKIDQYEAALRIAEEAQSGTYHKD